MVQPCDCARLISMTNPGEDAGETHHPTPVRGSEPSSGGQEAAPIEQSEPNRAAAARPRGRSRAPQPAYTTSPGYTPPAVAAIRRAGYPPPDFPPARLPAADGGPRPAAQPGYPPPPTPARPATARRRIRRRNTDAAAAGYGHRRSGYPPPTGYPHPLLGATGSRPRRRTTGDRVDRRLGHRRAVRHRFDHRHRARHRRAEPDQANQRRRPWTGRSPASPSAGVTLLHQRDLDDHPSLRRLTMTTSDPDSRRSPSAAPIPVAGELGERSPIRIAPVDYPIRCRVPPPVYPPPYPGCPGIRPGASGLLPGCLRPVPADEAARHQRHGDRRAGDFAGRVLLLRPAVHRRRDPRRRGDERDQAHRPGGLRDRVGRHHHRRTRASPSGRSILLLSSPHRHRCAAAP